MAKTKPTAPSPPAAAPVLSDRERGERVLVSQGRAVGLWPSLDADLQAQLAALATPAGDVLPTAVAGVQEVLIEYYARHKAVDATDEPPA